MERIKTRGGCVRTGVALALIAGVIGSGAMALAQEVRMATRGAKDYHEVEEGDTLYDLSARYISDAYKWPQLWSYNPHITNPHWIYPGDIVYLREETPGAAEPESSSDIRRIQTSYYQRTELHLAMGGFIESDEIKYSGRIVSSPKSAVLLATYDPVWVGFGDGAYTTEEKDEMDVEERRPMRDPGDLRVGNVYAIVRPNGKIMDAEGDRVLGHKYLLVGSLKLTELSDKYLQTAEIKQAWYEIERGDLLIPYEEQLKQVQIIKSQQNLVGEIVDTVEPRSNLGEFHYVYVNRGAADNVRVGNRFYVFQRREGLQPVNTQPSQDIPWSRVGQVLLIDVRENYSTGIVIDSTREIFVGDRLEMYEGY